ncbi:18.5 kDa class I heat shock protein-like [Rhodamnia argentea]|uniref:18.5 kDa class I heat shock protein-like n=1 Tax=Rhodamnia argentea TaxID=178133 RepID=A0A8B8PTK5_9MYRT|nr:18.5 kDa class I heat shock protein-like [Rhodamnia argentea]
MSIIHVTDRRRVASDDDPFSLDVVWDSFMNLRNDFPSLDLWDPFATSPFPSSSPSSRFPDFFTGALAPVRTRIDWRETREAHFFKGYFPGLGGNDVVIEVGANRVLRISGGECSSSFSLPEDVRLDLVTADMKDGFLVVTVPKVVEEAPRRDNVRVVEITD